MGENSSHVKKLILMGLLVALGTISSHLFWVPVGAAKAFPVQHAINVIAGILLGPGPAVLVAFLISLLRNFLGLGTLLAFPGSMIGALLAGVFYVRFGRESLALVGEVIGTGILGALASYPIAAFVLKNKTTAFFYVFPFTLSSLVGAVIAYLILKALRYLFKQEKESGK